MRWSRGGLGLGAATSSRANSISSCSRAERARRTLRSRAGAGLDGGVRLLIARPAGFLDPVSPRPSDALPGLEAIGLDPKEPTRLLHGRLEIGGPVLTQVPIAHAGRDRHPFAADVGSLDELGMSASQHLAKGLGLLDDKGDPWILAQILRPSRVLPRDHPEVAVVPFVPAHRDVGTAVRVEACEIHVDPEGEELFHLFRRHAPDLAPPRLFGV